MTATEREAVRDRAANRCEYCHLRQEHFPTYRHQIEHVVPKKHGGSDDPNNLALACIRCNLAKGPNLTGIDPDTGKVVVLFHPRTQAWDEHFAMVGAEVVGLSPAGRASVAVLNMNEDVRLNLREELLENGELTEDG